MVSRGREDGIMVIRFLLHAERFDLASTGARRLRRLRCGGNGMIFGIVSALCLNEREWFPQDGSLKHSERGVI